MKSPSRSDAACIPVKTDAYFTHRINPLRRPSRPKYGRETVIDSVNCNTIRNILSAILPSLADGAADGAGKRARRNGG